MPNNEGERSMIVIVIIEDSNSGHYPSSKHASAEKFRWIEEHQLSHVIQED